MPTSPTSFTANTFPIFTRRRAMLAGLLAAACASTVSADTVFATADPFNGPLGYLGFDVFPGQSVAARFIPTADYTLDRLSIWFMSNDFEGDTAQTVTITLRTDTNPGTQFTSVPSNTVLESWTMDLPVQGWNPELIDFDSAIHTLLRNGQKYWVVAESNVPAGEDPLWVWSGSGNAFTANTDGSGTPWESGSGAAIGLRVLGTTYTPPACPADLGVGGGGPGSDGLLDNNDFIAFITYFFASDARADVGIAAGLPGHDGAWDNNDFIAYINLFFDGCGG